GHHPRIAGLAYIAPPPSDVSTLSLHDALPIYDDQVTLGAAVVVQEDLVDQHDHLVGVLDGLGEERLDAPDESQLRADRRDRRAQDRKSTRLNSSHSQSSYAVFCLKKKNQQPGV